MGESFYFVNEAGPGEALNPVIVFLMKRWGNYKRCTGQLKEFLQQTGFAALLWLALMTTAAEGMPHLARKASWRLTFNLEGAAALWSRCDRQPWHFSEWSTALLAQKQILVFFSSYYPLSPPLRKAFLVLLVIDRNCNCGSLRVKPAYSAAELLLFSESPK